MFDRPQVNSEPSSLSLDQPLLEIRPDWERMAELGLHCAGIRLRSGGAQRRRVRRPSSSLATTRSTSGSTAGPPARPRTSMRCASCRWLRPAGRCCRWNRWADLRDTVDTDVVRRVDGRRMRDAQHRAATRRGSRDCGESPSRMSCCLHCTRQPRAARNVAGSLRRQRTSWTPRASPSGQIL